MLDAPPAAFGWSAGLLFASAHLSSRLLRHPFGGGHATPHSASWARDHPPLSDFASSISCGLGSFICSTSCWMVKAGFGHRGPFTGALLPCLLDGAKLGTRHTCVASPQGPPGLTDPHHPARGVCEAGGRLAPISGTAPAQRKTCRAARGLATPPLGICVRVACPVLEVVGRVYGHQGANVPMRPAVLVRETDKVYLRLRRPQRPSSSVCQGGLSVSALPARLFSAYRILRAQTRTSVERTLHLVLTAAASQAKILLSYAYRLRPTTSCVAKATPPSLMA